jgi:hypothetical protein
MFLETNCHYIGKLYELMLKERKGIGQVSIEKGALYIPSEVLCLFPIHGLNDFLMSLHFESLKLHWIHENIEFRKSKLCLYIDMAKKHFT